MTNKETLEFLRGAGVLIARVQAAKADGTLSRTETFGIIFHSMGQVWESLMGIQLIPQELKDIDELESEQIIGEMDNILRRSGKFTHRERDIAERLFRWLYRSVVEFSEITHLPPTAEPV